MVVFFSGEGNAFDFLKEIEKKWQKRWEDLRVFEAERDESKPKFMLTFAYPYINGRPHMGHAYTFMKAEVQARYRKMRGYNVLFGQGFHATGQPIVAAAKRVVEGDEKQINILKAFGVTDEEIHEFAEPKKWIEFFSEKWVEDLKAFGAAVDWRRTFYTTELNPPYDRFIRWQYETLRRKGLVKKGKHPVVWCPKDEIPVGDHDRRDEYIGIVPEEIVLIKFELRDKKVVTGTYRPETVYGVTNIWVHPDGQYVEAKVDGETWIVSKSAAEKLKLLDRDVEIISEFRGQDIVGRFVVNPVTGGRVPVLPSAFVDPEFATGVVMSVPAHAPYDWVAFEEAKREYADLLEGTSPVPLIEVEGYSEYPAKDACEKYGAKSTTDREALDKATDEIYKKEYYTGRLREIFGAWAGKTVKDVKDEIVKEFETKGIAERMWILPRPVECRCGAKCTVKLVEQWFLAYSDPAWKQLAHDATENTVFIPEEARNMVHHTIDWLRDWACTRDVQTSLGTRLPWDETQYVESLSDSTIYMVYYIIAKYLQHPEEYGIEWDRLTHGFFDYVLLGKGDANAVSKETGIPVEIIEQMRRDVEYWYPVDIRFTGKDLIQNHVTFTIFHHAALLPGKHPRAWMINGHVLVNGEKMSKSAGNFVTLEEALEKWGADVTRFLLAYAGNTILDDANIELSLVEDVARKVVEFMEFVDSHYGKGSGEEGIVEQWVRSEVQKIVKEVIQAYELGNTRDVINAAWFEMWRVVRKYLRFKEKYHGETMDWVLETWVKMLAPIIPHVCEEVWERMGKETLVSIESFPEPTEWPAFEGLDEYVDTLLDDVRTVVRLSGIEKPSKLTVVLAEDWKYDIIYALREGKEVGDVMSVLPESVKKEAGQFIAKARKALPKIPDIRGGAKIERKILAELKGFIEKETGLEVVILEGEHEKRKVALPFKPALVVE